MMKGFLFMSVRNVDHHCLKTTNTHKGRSTISTSSCMTGDAQLSRPTELENDHDEQQDFMHKADACAKRHQLQKWEQPTGEIFYILFNLSTVTVDRCLTLSGRKWRITLHGKEQIPSLHPQLEKVPESINDSHLEMLFAVTVGPLCVGSPDYVEQIPGKDVWFGNGEVKAQIETKGPYVFNGTSYTSTIRTIGCTKLAMLNDQCPVCKIYSADLNASAKNLSNCN